MKRINKIIAYLEGKVDIYNGQHEDAIAYWDEIWDEVKYMGYAPDTIEGLKKYAIELFGVEWLSEYTKQLIRDKELEMSNYDLWDR